MNSANNELRRRHGFSPTQAVFGKDPKIPGELCAADDKERYLEILLLANDNGRCIFVPLPGSPFAEHNLIQSCWCAFSELTKKGQKSNFEQSGGGPKRSLDMKVVRWVPLVGGATCKDEGYADDIDADEDKKQLEGDKVDFQFDLEPEDLKMNSLQKIGLPASDKDSCTARGQEEKDLESVGSHVKTMACSQVSQVVPAEA